MESLLFLAHRIPYPPNKGDKIRSFNLLKHLARDYRVHLGAFVDDPADWRYESALRELCDEVYLVGLHPRFARFASARGLLTNEALSLTYYRSSRMAAWVRSKLASGQVRRALIFSSPMAQYLRGLRGSGLHRVIDFVDVDSEKWRHYAPQHRWPMSWIYNREARKLLEFERAVANEFDTSVFVTREETQLFCRLAPETAPWVTWVNNGVDTDFFSPERSYSSPYPEGARPLVFTGAMDYWANVDAVTWFAREVFPRVRAAVREAMFYVVGARPTESVCRLSEIPGVHVTGAVKDIRPYLQHAAAAVAPLRIARGIQNKVLEAMAMGTPVLATRAAMDGLRIDQHLAALMHDDAGDLAEASVRVILEGDTEGHGASGRALVSSRYDWHSHLQQFEKLLEGGRPSPSSDQVDGVGTQQTETA